MRNQQAANYPQGHVGPSIRDPAFEPHSSFAFEDDPSNFEGDMGSFGMLQPGDMDLSLMNGM